MSSQPHRAILFAVGSLPFWTGKRKLIRFLAGEPGSYWQGETPLKPIYLNHAAYGALRDRSPSRIRQHLQTLLTHDYLRRADLAPDKPYKVIKFSDAGCKKYYNLLVLERGITDPLWWLHHLAQLRDPPRSPIHSGGELFAFSGDLYLSQSPPSLPPAERVKDEQTLRLAPGDRDLKPDRSYRFQDLTVVCDRGVHLAVGESTSGSTLAASDVRRELAHFPGRDDAETPNPYVLKGTLRSVEETPENHRILGLENGQGQQLLVRASPAQIPDDVTLETGSTYVLGPVRETDDDREEAGLRLSDSGSIAPFRP